jgi:mannosyltransferase OCH1-like enzyme
VVVVTVAIAVALVYAPHGGPCTPPQPREPSGAIPEQLFMTGPWPEDALPGPIRDSVESWRRHGPPGLRIHWFDEPAREAWVAKYFPQYLDAYRSLVPGAYQADLWRVLVLFAHGGVYSDAGTLLQEPLWTAMRGCSLVFSRDLGPKNISQGVLGAVQGHPVLIHVAKAIAANVAKKYYGANGLCPTGPVLYGDVFRAWFTSKDPVIADPATGKWNLGKHHHTKVLLFDGKAAFDTTNGARKLLWQSKVPGYHKVMYNNRGVKQYGALWTERAIYRNIEPTTAAIPARLFMTGPFPAGRLPRKFANNVATWKRLGPPGFTVHWFDDTAAEQWIAAHFPQYLSEYQVLVPGAFKADLWRLLVLYKYGGLYSDAGVYPMQSLWPMFRDASLVIVADGNPRNIWQGIIGAVAQHPILFAMIEHVVANVRGRKYMEDMLSVTGPRAVAFAAKQFMNYKSPMLGSDGEWLPGHYGPTGLVLVHKPPLKLLTAADELFGHTKIPGYAHDMYIARKKRHYGDLWLARAIYADGGRATSAIPHTLFMTGPFPKDALPPALAANVQAWQLHGPPDLVIRWFDDAAAKAWIETHFPQFVHDYDVLVPGAFKADLWRLLVVHKHGGVYADAGTSPVVPIWPLFDEASLVFCRDMKFRSGRKDIWQGVIAATPGHPIIWAMVTHVVANIRKRFYGSHYLAVTGPKAVSIAAKAAYRATHKHLLSEDGGEEWVAGNHGEVVIWSFSPGAIHTADGTHIINTKVPRYNDIMYRNRGVPKYSVLWQRRSMYRDGNAVDAQHSSSVTPPQWCVLLTTCIKPILSRADAAAERLRAYTMSLSKWFDDTQDQGVPVFVVESSGTALPADINPQVTDVFRISQNPAHTSVTQTEADSVLHALAKFQDAMQSYTHVLKVTGRYFIPNIDELLSGVPDVDVVLQHTHSKAENHTEVLGFRKSLAPTIFGGIPLGTPIEAHVLHVIARDRLSTFRLAPIPNVLKVKRGAGDLVDPL